MGCLGKNVTHKVGNDDLVVGGIVNIKDLNGGMVVPIVVSIGQGRERIDSIHGILGILSGTGDMIKVGRRGKDPTPMFVGNS